MQLFNIFPDSKLSSKGVGGKGGGGGVGFLNHPNLPIINIIYNRLTLLYKSTQQKCCCQ